MPGPGAKGVGDVAMRNYDAWKEIRINMDTICENVTPDTSIELFGEKFAYPFFAGPVGAMKLHYGEKYDDLEYNDILVSACAANGLQHLREMVRIRMYLKGQRQRSRRIMDREFQQ